MCGRYILIESKWNLKNDWAKTCYQLAHDINRIKVEFKVTKQRDYMIAELHINRIKVEFKGPM